MASKTSMLLHARPSSKVRFGTRSCGLVKGKDFDLEEVAAAAAAASSLAVAGPDDGAEDALRPAVA